MKLLSKENIKSELLLDMGETYPMKILKYDRLRNRAWLKSKKPNSEMWDILASALYRIPIINPVKNYPKGKL